jgi:hypothetical protein
MIQHLNILRMLVSRSSKQEATGCAFPAMGFSIDAQPPANGGGNGGARPEAERGSALHRKLDRKDISSPLRPPAP